MAWDSAAENMAVNVIAKVEGAGAWDAINYNDPITIGLMQWFGTRAAGLLSLIESGAPAEYAKIDSGLRADHAANSDTSRYWTSRYLTKREGDSLKPVLRATKGIQGDQVREDIVDYKRVAERIGMNPDTNTDAVIFWMCMYHQSPARSINLMKRLGMGSSLERVYRGAYNERVFSRYRSRYTQAYNYIKSGTPPVIIDLNDEDEELGDDQTAGPDGPSGDGRDSLFDQVRTSIKRIEVIGDQLLIHLADDSKAFAVPTGGQNYIISAKFDGEVIPDEPPAEDETGESEPPPPTGNDATDTQNKLVKFMTDRIGKYGYSQGPGRLTPDRSGVTDCSALVRYAYLSITGKDVGTYTDAQVTNNNTFLVQKGGGGNSPDESKMKPGDLVITARYGTRAGRIASHVEMYMGNNQTIGHGGIPYMGPVTKQLKYNTANKRDWWVKRLKGL